MRTGATSLALLLALGTHLATIPTYGQPNQGNAPTAAPAPVAIFEGDGLTLVIFTADEAGPITGELRRGDARFPLKGKMEQKGDAEIVTGTFTAQGASFEFHAQRANEDAPVTFTTGGKSYKLVYKEPAVVPDNGPIKPQAPAAPPAAPATPPAPPAHVPPAHVGPPASPHHPPAAPANGAPAAPAAPARDAKPLKLSTASFPDVTMGGVTAYTILVPEGWTAEGKVEWSTGDIVYPEKSIKINGPENACVRFAPTLHAWHMVTDPQWIQQMQAQGLGAGIQAEQGMRPPENMGQWIIDMVKKANVKEIANVRLIDQKRRPDAEKAINDLQQKSGLPPIRGMQMHWVAIGYELSGVPMREEILLTLTISDPVQGMNWNSRSWSLVTDLQVRAPEKSFAEYRPLLSTIAGSLRPTAKWWAQEIELLAELSRQRLKNVQAQIAARAKMYDQISNDMMERWKKEQASGDKQQHNFINTIKEREDYQNQDGTVTNLPAHYDYVYGDGNGNYLLTNTTNIKPPHDWSQLPQVR